MSEFGGYEGDMFGFDPYGHTKTRTPSRPAPKVAFYEGGVLVGMIDAHWECDFLVARHGEMGIMIHKSELRNI